MNSELLEILRCPYCGGRLEVSWIESEKGKAEYGKLTCPCDNYPVVSGIPILKKDTVGTRQVTTGRLLEMLESDRREEALFSVLFPVPRPYSLVPDFLGHVPRLFGRSPLRALLHRLALRSWQREARAMVDTLNVETLTALDLLKFIYVRSRLGFEAYNHFAYRFGQPRHLVALSFVNSIEGSNGRSLELASGFGHITRSIAERTPGGLCVGLDRAFYTAYVAKSFIAPEAAFVCCDIDDSLPFVDQAFARVFCVDGIHYVRKKAGAMRELVRVTPPEGVFCLASSRNALFPNPNAGIPLTPEGYRTLMGELKHRMVSDREILNEYLNRRGPSLARPRSVESLLDEPLLSIVASRRGQVFQNYGTFEKWPHVEGRLSVNPLYRVNGRDHEGTLTLRRTFPSKSFELENESCRLYLPEQVTLGPELIRSLDRQEMTPQLESLIECCVILGLPERYRSSDNIV